MFGTYPLGASVFGDLVTPSTTDPVFSKIQFNDLDLQSSSVITSRIDYSTAPEREIDMNASPRAHGEFINSAYWRRKIITLQGTIKADTMAELDDLMDSIKQGLNVKTGTLYITMPDGQVRTFVAVWTNTQEIFANRQAYNVTFMPFSITFECITPFGLNRELNYISELGATSAKTMSVFNAGSADSKPYIIVGINSATDLSALEIEHIETGRKITMADLTDTAPSSIIVDMEEFEATQDGVTLDFAGQFLDLQAGGNSYLVTPTATAYNIDITILWNDSYL